MKKQKRKPILRRVAKWQGVQMAADRLGCSKQHLSEVLRGMRKASPAISKYLRSEGVAIDAEGYVREARHA